MCDGAWGGPAARLGERIRQGARPGPLAVVRAARSGGWRTCCACAAARGRPVRRPASCCWAATSTPPTSPRSARGPRCGAGCGSSCAPRSASPSTRGERRLIRALFTRPRPRASRPRMARAAHAPRPSVSWRVRSGPTFDNSIGVIEVDGRSRPAWPSAGPRPRTATRPGCQPFTSPISRSGRAGTQTTSRRGSTRSPATAPSRGRPRPPRRAPSGRTRISTRLALVVRACGGVVHGLHGHARHRPRRRTAPDAARTPTSSRPSSSCESSNSSRPANSFPTLPTRTQFASPRYQRVALHRDRGGERLGPRGCCSPVQM